jgi:hypothetical protein
LAELGLVHIWPESELLQCDHCAAVFRVKKIKQIFYQVFACFAREEDFSKGLISFNLLEFCEA